MPVFAAAYDRTGLSDNSPERQDSESAFRRELCVTKKATVEAVALMFQYFKYFNGSTQEPFTMIVTCR